MFHGTHDREVRADRYRKVAAEYAELSKAAGDPHLASYYLRIAEDYQDQLQGELRALEKERVAALAEGTIDAKLPGVVSPPVSPEITSATAE
jgi:hypothetical protein